MRKVLAATPEQQTRGSLRDVQHVLFLMEENRTFDQYFGTLSGAAGFDDPAALRLPDGRPVWYQPYASNPDGYVLPFHLDTTTTNSALGVGLDNDWVASHMAWNNGRMDGFVSGQVPNAGANAPLAMGYYDRGDLPFHYALADAFTVCDHFHVPYMGDSLPNHTYAVAASIDPAGLHGGPVVNNSFSGKLTGITTFYERLQAAGVTWHDYCQQEAGPELGLFTQFANAPTSSPLYQNGMVPRPYPAVLDDIRNDNLPQFARIRPPYPPESDEHPGQSLTAYGADFMYNVLEAFGQNPDVWAKSVLFIAYDDAGGLFDHVVPPTPPPGTEGEFLTVSPLPAVAGGIAGPIGLGFRCAALVVSPWSRGGWVASETFDFTSIIKFCERLFGVHEPNITAWRRRAVGDLTSALRFTQPDLTIPQATDPATSVILAQQQSGMLAGSTALPGATVPAVQVVPRQESPGAALADLQVSLSARVVPAGQQVTVTAVLRNAPPGAPATGGTGTGQSPLLRIRRLQPSPLTGVTLSVTVPDGWSQQATSATSFPLLAAGSEAKATWRLTTPASAPAGLYPSVSARYLNGAGANSQEVLLDSVLALVSIPTTLAAAFNNLGIVSDAAGGADFDVFANGYSQEALTAAGFPPGTAVTAGGVQYVLADVAAGQPDNVYAIGQSILAPGQAGASILGFMGAASNADSSGTVTLTYTDGTTQDETLSFTDWTGTPEFGNTVVVTMPYQDAFAPPFLSQLALPTSIFATAPITLQAGKTLQYVTLPAAVSYGQIHVFSIGTDQGPFS